jgi:hypothetical protein
VAIPIADRIDQNRFQLSIFHHGQFIAVTNAIFLPYEFSANLIVGDSSMNVLGNDTSGLEPA